MFQNSKLVIILGGNILNSGIVDYCNKHGYKVVIVDWSPKAYLKGDLFLCLDVKYHEPIIRALVDNGISSILGAYTSIDLAVPSVNAINSHYGLKSMDIASIEKALPKAAMTSVWKEAGLLNRFSQVFDSLDESVLEKLSFMKLIFKPNISSSSRGITILEKGTDNSLAYEAFEKAKNESFDKKVIVEEFVQGREFTCEMLGDSYGNVSVYAISVKYHTQNTSNNKIATKLHYNSNFYSNEIFQKIAETGKRCYKALGFKSSLGHLEIILKDDGTMSPVEIGARSSGYIAHPLVSLASGQDFFGDYLKVINGEKLSGLDYINGGNSSMYFFYDMPQGTCVHHPCSLMDFLPNGISSQYHNRSKVMQLGNRFENISNDNERVGYEILYGNREIMSIQRIEKAEQDFLRYNTKQ